MLMTVAEFTESTEHNLEPLVAELRALTGRHGEEEAKAWRSSLPKLAAALGAPSIAALHLHFQTRAHHVAVEYPLPGAASWCDVVLLGAHEGNPAAVIFELKNWDTNGDRPGAWEGLIERWGVQDLHPSEQVRGYAQYCQRFHSTVLDRKALVHGCVLFTKGFAKRAYELIPNAALTEAFPIFTTSDADVGQALPDFLRSRLTEADPEFAVQFAEGGYRQDRSFMSQIGAEILGTETGGAFELLDNQRRAFALCKARISRFAEKPSSSERKVVIVEGPPGSGKSAVAARLWASLVSNPEVRDGNISLVTTSQSQSSNWVHLINQVSGERAGWGVTRKATQFSPITTHQLNQLRLKANDPSLYRDAEHWRQHLAKLRQDTTVRYQPGAADFNHLVSLVDEAHALINPEREHGVGQYGFVTGLGPQAYHIMRASRLTVFFMDPEQSFRIRENTRIQDIEDWAEDLQADVERVSLAGAQFRCAGSAEYVAWVESLLAGESAEVNRVHASAWQGGGVQSGHSELVYQHAEILPPNVIPFPATAAASTLAVSNREFVAAEAAAWPAVTGAAPLFDVQIFDSPIDLEKALRVHHPQATIRLLSSYSRRWKTYGLQDPHNEGAQAWDFYEKYVVDGKTHTWAKPWNVVPGNGSDYTAFVQGRPGYRMHEDPLCEVGCTYAVRGFDFHYVGLIWLDDLVWRNGLWKVQVENVHESGIGVLTRRAAHEGELAPAGPHGTELLRKVCQAYRILMTRSIRGLYIWAADAETRAHLRNSLVAP